MVENECEQDISDECCHFIVDYISSGGGDTNPLPVCRQCGWIIYEKK